VLVRAGLPPPEVQYEIVDEYGFVLARADLAYPGAKLALEYDGAVHFDRDAAHRDRQRDAMLAGYGWLTVRLCAEDLYAAQTVHRIDSLLAQRTEFNRGGLAPRREPRCG
jgi:very-short-patch-repair endonuclease